MAHASADTLLGEGDAAWAAGHGRRLLGSPFDNETFMWAMIAIGIVIGVCLLVFVLWLIITKCGRGKRSTAVAPDTTGAILQGQKVEGDVEKGHTINASGNGVQNSYMQQNAALGPMHPAPQQMQLTPGYHDPMAPPEQQLARSAPGAFGPVTVQAGPQAAPQAPVPPWQHEPSRLPPGIVLSPVTPPTYSPLVSNPRLATEPPYERLVLISSRVHMPERVAAAVLPNVAYLVYDWKNFTLQELLRYVRKVLGAQKVVTIAVVSPGTKPGCVGLLEGATTSADKLTSKTELSQFWRVLSGCVALSGTADGRRVDLLGCRVVEAPREGAALLKELWNLTTVPFAAADDALGGYMLSTFMEEPSSRQLSLISSTIPAIDLYFSRNALLGLPHLDAPRAAVAAAAPLPPGPPPPFAIAPVGTAPPLPPPVPALVPLPLSEPVPHQALPPQAALLAAVQAEAPAPPLPEPVPPEPAQVPQLQLPHSEPPAPAPVPLPVPPLPLVHSAAPPPSQPAPADLDIFARLTAALQQHGKTPQAAFDEFDANRNGQLSTEELTNLMKTYVPTASAMDVKHFQAMLDTDLPEGAAEQGIQVSAAEFTEGLPHNVAIHAAVREGRDEDEVIPRLQDYLTDNEAIMRDVYQDFDRNGNGTLDHAELQQVAACIPGLDAAEKKFVLAYLYLCDADHDSAISFDELRASLTAFGKPRAPTLARHVQDAAAAAGAAQGAAPHAAGAAGAQLQGAQQALPPPAPLPQQQQPASSFPALGPPKLAPLAPLGGAEPLPRPGGLAPLAPLPGRREAPF